MSLVSKSMRVLPLFLLAGCFEATSTSVEDFQNKNNEICPFKSGQKYDVKAISKGVATQIATVQFKDVENKCLLVSANMQEPLETENFQKLLAQNHYFLESGISVGIVSGEGAKLALSYEKTLPNGQIDIYTNCETKIAKCSMESALEISIMREYLDQFPVNYRFIPQK